MKKLLPAMLAILMLGAIGCGNKIDPGVQTDEKIQGGWVFENEDYFLYISAAQMSVKYITDVVTPYRTEFSYTPLSPSDRYSKADETEIKGEMTLYSYKDNVEIAILELILTIDKEDAANNTLEIVTVTYSEPEYYYAYAMPRVGLYSNLYESGGTIPQPPSNDPGAIVNTSLDGVWESSAGTIVTISGSTGIYTAFGSFGALFQDAVDKGFINVGDERFRNITSTGNLTWSAQILAVTYNSSAPNVATGTDWNNCTITMSEDGRTITAVGTSTSTLTRK